MGRFVLGESWDRMDRTTTYGEMINQTHLFNIQGFPKKRHPMTKIFSFDIFLSFTFVIIIGIFFNFEKLASFMRNPVWKRAVSRRSQKQVQGGIGHFLTCFAPLAPAQVKTAPHEIFQMRVP